MKLYPDELWEQLLIDAPFQWYLRHQAASHSTYSLAELSEEDEKLESYLDALFIGIKEDTKVVSDHDFSDEGMLFVMAVIALRLDNYEILQQCVDSLITESDVQDQKAEELFLALQWQPPTDSQVRFLIKQKHPHVVQAAIAAFPADIQNNVIQPWLVYQDKPIVLQLLIFIGSNQLNQYINYVQYFYNASDNDIRFKAACMGLLLADKSALDVIKQFAQTNNDKLRESLLWLFCFSEKEHIPRFVDNVLGMDWSPRIQALCIAYSGLTQYIPNLFPLLRQVDVAQVAGEAFSLITGVDLVEDNFDDNEPEGDEPSAADKYQLDDQYNDYEENLPWPHVEKIEQWWQNNKNEFSNDNQYFSGQRIALDNLQNILISGYQLERHIAALHLVALEQPYFSVKQKISYQQAQLTNLIQMTQGVKA